MNIIFFGSSDYCIPVLETLNNKFNLTAIVTKQNTAAKSFALSHNIKVFTPPDHNELSALKKEIISLQPDLAIVADYGLIIPKEIFTIPRYKTLNIHFSKLPKLRGPSPVQYTILLGEKSAWISVIIMDEEIDTGDIVWQKEIKLAGNETSGSLYAKLFNIIASELPDIIKKYINNELKPQKQDNSQATYTEHLTREDGFIPAPILAAALNWKSNILLEKEINNWQLAATLTQLPTTNYQLLTFIERAVRALSPWPGVWTTVFLTPRGWQAGVATQTMTPPTVKGTEIKKRLKILMAHLENYDFIPDRKHKTIPYCKYKLVPDLVQLEGKKPVSWKQFLQGYPHFVF